jgi:hypothetical protein
MAIALVPLAAYLAVVGAINLRRRPFLTSGACDLAALGGALTGLAIVGPIELFIPEAAAIRFGNYVWFFLLVFYWLCLSLIALLARPRIVVYNVTVEELRPVLAEVVGPLDADARWAGDALTLPSMGVQLHYDIFSMMRCVSLVASGARQNLPNWRRLETQLAAALTKLPVRRNRRGAALVALAVLFAISALTHLLAHPRAVAQSMNELFW